MGISKKHPKPGYNIYGDIIMFLGHAKFIPAKTSLL